MRELRPGLPSLCGIGIATFLFGLATAGCTRAAPTAPDSVARAGSQASLLTEQPAVSFELVNGLFDLKIGSDHLAGTYTGRAEYPASENADASLDLQVTRGSGAFKGATGTLRGDGTGAFSGEGPFSLSLSGVLRTAAKRGSLSFRAVTTGISTASCLNGRILLTLEGSGSSTLGPIKQKLQHEIANTECSS